MLRVSKRVVVLAVEGDGLFLPGGRCESCPAAAVNVPPTIDGYRELGIFGAIGIFTDPEEQVVGAAAEGFRCRIDWGCRRRAPAA
jgi:hypothetical protein